MILEYLVEKCAKLSNFLFRPLQYTKLSVKDMQKVCSEVYGNDAKFIVYNTRILTKFDKLLAAIQAALFTILYMSILVNYGIFTSSSYFSIVIFFSSYVTPIYLYQYLLFLKQKMYE